MEDVYERLDKALMEYSDDEAECILGVSELDGFMHALACAPTLLLPSDWLSAIWGGEEFAPNWPSIEEAQAFLTDAMALYNSVMTSLHGGECAPVFLEHDQKGKTYVIVDEWCEGFYLGMRLWGEAVADVPLEILEPILFFTVDLDEPEESMALREAMSDDDIEAMQNRIPQSVFEIREHFGIGV